MVKTLPRVSIKLPKWHISLNGVEVSKEIEGLVEPFRLPQFVIPFISLPVQQVSSETPDSSQASFSILVL